MRKTRGNCRDKVAAEEDFRSQTLVWFLGIGQKGSEILLSFILAFTHLKDRAKV